MQDYHCLFNTIMCTMILILLFNLYFGRGISENLKGTVDNSGTFSFGVKASEAGSKPPIYYAGVISPDEYISNNNEIPPSKQHIFYVNVSKDYIDSNVQVILRQHNISFGIMNIQQQEEIEELKINFHFDKIASVQPRCWPRKTNAIT